MAKAKGTAVPASMPAGTNERWQVTYSDHDSDDGWELRYYIVVPGENPLQIAATGTSGGIWDAEITAQMSARFSRGGEFRWVARANKTGAADTDGTIDVASGSIFFKPDPTAPHQETSAELKVRLLETSIAGDLVDAQESVDAFGINVTKITMSERFRLLELAKAELRRERQKLRQMARTEAARLPGYQIRFK